MSSGPGGLEQLWVLAPDADLAGLEDKVCTAVAKFFDGITDNNSWNVIRPTGSHALWHRGKWVGSVLLWTGQAPIPVEAWRRAMPAGAKVWRVHDDGQEWEVVGPSGDVVSRSPTPWKDTAGYPDRQARMQAAELFLHSHLKAELFDVPSCSAWINAIQDDRPQDLEVLLRDQFWTPDDIKEWWRFAKDYLLAPQPLSFWRNRTWGPLEESDPALRQQKTAQVLHAMACALPFYERKPAKLNALLRAAQHQSWRVQSVGLACMNRMLRPWVNAVAFWKMRGLEVSLEGLGVDAFSRLSDFKELPTRSAHTALNGALERLRTGAGPRPDSNETYGHTVWLHEAAPKWPHWLEVFTTLSARSGASDGVRALAAQLRSQHLASQWEEPKPAVTSRPRM